VRHDVRDRLGDLAIELGMIVGLVLVLIDQQFDQRLWARQTADMGRQAVGCGGESRTVCQPLPGGSRRHRHHLVGRLHVGEYPIHRQFQSPAIVTLPGSASPAILPAALRRVS
jgi:hypothetical protein